MKINLSLVVISFNAERTIEKTLKSVQNLVNDIIVVDNYSTDKTVEIAKKYKAKVLFYKDKNRGIQCQMGVNKAKNEWILVLDSDESLPKQLKEEIKYLLNNNPKFDGYNIPFQSFYLGKPLYYGGENYKKLILFKKSVSSISHDPIHYVCKIKTNKIGKLRYKINHYSYRNIIDVYNKFTNYALYEARLKIKAGEKTSLKKIVMYPIHMFWARFIKDKGYKDGMFRIPLDLGFAYMEFLTYFSMLFIKNPKSKVLNSK